MEILVAGQSAVEADLIGRESVEVRLNGESVVEASLDGQMSLDANLERQPAIEVLIDAKVIDSYKEVDQALSKMSKNPISNQAVANAIESITPILMSEAEFEILETKDENRTYFVYEEE